MKKFIIVIGLLAMIGAQEAQAKWLLPLLIGGGVGYLVGHNNTTPAQPTTTIVQPVVVPVPAEKQVVCSWKWASALQGCHSLIGDTVWTPAQFVSSVEGGLPYNHFDITQIQYQSDGGGFIQTAIISYRIH